MLKEYEPNFEKYGKNIENIIKEPTYLARNEKIYRIYKRI